MRRFSSASLAALLAILGFTAFWSGCGGGSNNSTFAVTKFIFSPTSISLEPGQVVQVSATPYNASGSVVSATVTYTLSDGKTQTSPAVSISQGGALCAGAWNATYTLCTPGNPPQVGTYQIEAAANGATAKATVYIHYHVDAVYLSAPSAVCTSMGKTAGVTATACSTLADTYSTTCQATSTLCSSNNMCDITSSVGSFSYGVLDSTVASIDSNGNLTAGIPGTTKLYASVSSGTGGNATVSTAVPYTTCLVDSISLHVASKTDTSLTVAKGSSVSLAADVLDTAGTSITPTLAFNDLQSVVGSVTATSTSNSSTYAGLAPGYGGVVASCTPPNCNKNMSAVYSNVVTTAVQNSSSDTGVTANETNVYVSGIGAVQVYPVDTTNFTLGTLISLPYPVNSILMSRDGTRVFLGSSTYAMVIDTSSNSVQSLSFPGQVLAVAPNNAYVIFSNPTNTGLVYITAGSSFTITNTGGFAIPGVKAATFTPDGNTVYFASGSNLYRYRIVGDSGSTPTPLTLTPGGAPLSATANDVKTSANGTVLFSSTSPRIAADETCNANVAASYLSAFEPLGGQNFTSPTQLAALPNGAGMLAVDGTTIDQVTITNPNPLTSPFAGCPATGFATSPSTISLSALGSGFKVNQLVMSNSGHYAAVLTGCTGGACTPKVGIIDLVGNTLTPVTLVDKGGSALTQIYSGDFMLDDSGLWVGADDSYIHFVSTSKLADTQQVQVQIQAPSSGSTINYVNPSLVAIQHK